MTETTSTLTSNPSPTTGKQDLSAETVHDKVSAAYARAVTRETEGGCCTPATPKGVAAKTAGYSAEELAELPAEAVTNSFGCGNPLAFAEVRPGDVVVDLGSGAGLDLLIAAGRVGPEGRAIGIDMTDEMLDKAGEVIRASGLTNVEVRKGLIEDLPVASGSVDWVISNCVINLSPDKERVFAEIARVLKPGGRLRVSDIVAQDLPAWVSENQGLYNSCISGAISEEVYIDGLRRAGLTDVTVTERLVYDASQLVAVVQSDLADLAQDDDAATGCGCGGEPIAGLDKEALTTLAEQVAGKVWSARFSATRS